MFCQSLHTPLQHLIVQDRALTLKVAGTLICSGLWRYPTKTCANLVGACPCGCRGASHRRKVLGSDTWCCRSRWAVVQDPTNIAQVSLTLMPQQLRPAQCTEACTLCLDAEGGRHDARVLRHRQRRIEDA